MLDWKYHEEEKCWSAESAAGADIHWVVTVGKDGVFSAAGSTPSLLAVARTVSAESLEETKRRCQYFEDKIVQSFAVV